MCAEHELPARQLAANSTPCRARHDQVLQCSSRRMRGCQLCRQAGGGAALGYLRRCILSRFCELLCCFVGQLAACVFLSAETTIILYDRPNGDGSEEGANFADRRAGGAALGCHTDTLSIALRQLRWTNWLESVYLVLGFEIVLGQTQILKLIGRLSCVQHVTEAARRPRS